MTIGCRRCMRMARSNRNAGLEQTPPRFDGPSEPESHTEHRAALDATIFRAGADPYELVLELEAGELRVRDAQRRR